MTAMSRKRARASGEAPSRGEKRSWVRSVWVGIRTLLIVGVILYITGLFVGRTDGFASLVAQRVENVLGMPVRIGSTKLTAAYGLKIRDLVSEGTRRESSPGIRASRVSIEWRWSDLWRRGRVGIAHLELEKPVVVFAEQEKGGWAPAPLADVGEFLLKQMQFSLPVRGQTRADAAPAAEKAETQGKRNREKYELTAGLTKLDMTVSIRRGDVVWWTGGGAPAASIEGVDLFVTPLHLPGRELTHYLLKVDRAASTAGPGMRDLTIELLDMADQQVVLRFLGEHVSVQSPKP